GRLCQIDRTRLGGYMADGRSGLLDRLAAGGYSLVGACRSGGRKQSHARDVDVELVGSDLGQRGNDALSDLDLARTELDCSIATDAQPLRQPRVALQAGWQLRGAGSGELSAGRCHAARASLAARSTARTTRLWAPQRQRLRSSAALTSASVG